MQLFFQALLRFHHPTDEGGPHPQRVAMFTFLSQQDGAIPKVRRGRLGGERDRESPIESLADNGETRDASHPTWSADDRRHDQKQWQQ